MECLQCLADQSVDRSSGPLINLHAGQLMSERNVGVFIILIIFIIITIISNSGRSICVRSILFHGIILMIIIIIVGVVILIIIIIVIIVVIIISCLRFLNLC